MIKRILVLAAAALVLFGMNTPSRAVTDFSIGASVRIDTGWQLSDLGDRNGTGGEDSQTQFFVAEPGNSRINFTATVGDVTGFVELALIPTDVILRHAYASWDMGGGHSLLFGRTWSIMAFGFSDMRLGPSASFLDNANIGFGTLYFGRKPQIRYTYVSEAFTVNLAIEDPEAFFALFLGLTGPFVPESEHPRLTGSVTVIPIEMATLTPSAFYHSFDLTGAVPGVSDVDVDAFGFALDGEINFEIVHVSFEAWIGENLGATLAVPFLRLLGLAIGFDSRPGATVPFGAPVPDATGTDLEDVTSWGGFLQLTFRFEPVIVNLGAGYQQAEVENTDGIPAGAVYEDDIWTASYFINVLYNFTDTFYIQPEVSFFDYGDDANKNAFGTGQNDLGYDLVFGVHFQADF